MNASPVLAHAITPQSDRGTRLDLSDVDPQEHEEALAFAWAALLVGESFLLIAPRMPLALLHKFFHTRSGVFVWQRLHEEAGRCQVAVRRLGPDPLLRREVPRSPALGAVVSVQPAPDRATRRLLRALESGRRGSVVHACVRGEPERILKNLRGRGLEHLCEYAGNGAWILSIREKKRAATLGLPATGGATGQDAE